MNTCAECRFWKRVDLSVRSFEIEPGSSLPGEWRECKRGTREDDEDAFYVAALYADDFGLITRSDFGCVQFEAARCAVVGEPEAGRKVCELPAGHEGYHQQGSVRWLGYHPTSK